MKNSINKDGLVPPVADLGLAANFGFQSQVYADQRPYTRATYTVTAVQGGEFQTSTRLEPGNQSPKSEK